MTQIPDGADASAPVAPPNSELRSEVQRWGVAASVIDAQPAVPGEREASNGTKHFKPGAKLTILGWATDSNAELVAIGHHRKSRQYVKGIVPVASVQELSVEVITTATVLALACKHELGGGATLTQEHAEALVAAIAKREQQ